MTFASHLRASVLATVILLAITCGAYPLIVWGIAQAAFSSKADGSLIQRDGKVVGSALIGQAFAAPNYFHPRPSAAGNGYDPTSSSGTNLGPTSDKLLNGQHKKTDDGKDDPTNLDGIRELVAAYRAENGLDEHVLVPADAVTRSGSGLDPHISPANARLQATRVAQERHLDQAEVERLIARCTEGPDLGILGEPGVNVLRLNLALDERR